MSQLATFKIGEELFGIDLLLTKEISKINELTTVPGAPTFVAGLMNLRGQIVTVVKPALIMEKNEKKIDEESRLLILKTRKQAEILLKRGLISDVSLSEDALAFIIDNVGDIMEYEEDDISPTPPHIKERHRDIVCGVIQTKKGLVVVLSVESLVKKIKNLISSSMEAAISKKDKIMKNKSI